LRPVLPSVRPFRTGTLLLFGALTLALAADTLGIGPAGVRHGYWHASFFEHHGGVLGEAEFWIAGHLVGQAGADILAGFLAIAGLTLLSGGGLAVLLRAGGAGVLDATRTLRTARPTTAARTAGSSRRTSTDAVDDDPFPADPDAAADGRHDPDAPIYADAEPPLPYAMAERIVPPEPLDRELVVRATHVEAPPIFDLDGELDPAGESLPPDARNGKPGTTAADAAADDNEPDRANPADTANAANGDPSDPRGAPAAPEPPEAQLSTDDLQA